MFVSAYDNAAVDAFELHALDYLRKPVGRVRVEEALDRIASAVEADSARRREREAPTGARPPGEYAGERADRGGQRALGLDPPDRAAARSSTSSRNGDFVRIVTGDGRYLLRATLGEIERRWRACGFVRVHRQYVANLFRAVELRPRLGGTADLVFADGQTIPIARRHMAELGRRLAL